MAREMSERKSSDNGSDNEEWEMNEVIGYEYVCDEKEWIGSEWGQVVDERMNEVTVMAEYE